MGRWMTRLGSGDSVESVGGLVVSSPGISRWVTGRGVCVKYGKRRENELETTD